MKWKNKGNELIEYKKRICKIFDSHKKIIVFGAGNIGSRICRTLKAYGIFAGYADNDIRKQNIGYEGEKVFVPDDLLNTGAFVVIAGNEVHTNEIKAQLILNGLKEDGDFIDTKEFESIWFPVLSFFYFNKLYTNLAQICITERCTLKCKKCAHACHLVDINSDDMPLDKAKESADYFFKAFDCVSEFDLIGGEPFLYNKLGELIEYISSKYRDKIIFFTITTNGTIIPKQEIIDLCKKYNITIRVSDYSKTIPTLEKYYKKLYEKLSGLNSIIWETDNKASWFDYGFNSGARKSIKNAQKTFDMCKTICREINGSKYYYCVMAHTVAQNMKLEIGQDDYFDMSKVYSKNELLEFEVGYSDKGYLDMCSICRGKDAENYLIPAAEQVKA